jgi:cytochrome c553
MKLTGWRSRALLSVCAGGLLLIAASARLPATEENVDDLVHTALQLDAEPKRGAVLYKQQCRSCHGPNALGDATRRIPSLAGQRQAYVIRQLADFSELERDSKDMHAIVARAGVNDPQAWADLAAYLNACAVAHFPQHGDGTKLALGEGMFREQCASCHSEDARGDDDGFVPSLRNQHFSYLLAQMHGLADGHRRNVDQSLLLFFANLKNDEREGLADYLSRLQGPVKDRLKMRDNGVVGD